jgi:hypothetical protein
MGDEICGCTAGKLAHEGPEPQEVRDRGHSSREKLEITRLDSDVFGFGVESKDTDSPAVALPRVALCEQAVEIAPGPEAMNTHKCSGDYGGGLEVIHSGRVIFSGQHKRRTCVVLTCVHGWGSGGGGFSPRSGRAPA